MFGSGLEKVRYLYTPFLEIERHELISFPGARGKPVISAPKFWSPGHGALTMREDWRQHVAMAHRDLGIQRVRFHGILDDDMSVSFSANETARPAIQRVLVLEYLSRYGIR